MISRQWMNDSFELSKVASTMQKLVANRVEQDYVHAKIESEHRQKSPLSAGHSQKADNADADSKQSLSKMISVQNPSSAHRHLVRMMECRDRPHIAIRSYSADFPLDGFSLEGFSLRMMSLEYLFRSLIGYGVSPTRDQDLHLYALFLQACCRDPNNVVLSKRCCSTI